MYLNFFGACDIFYFIIYLFWGGGVFHLKKHQKQTKLLLVTDIYFDKFLKCIHKNYWF